MIFEGMNGESVDNHSSRCLFLRWIGCNILDFSNPIVSVLIGGLDVKFLDWV